MNIHAARAISTLSCMIVFVMCIRSGMPTTSLFFLGVFSFVGAAVCFIDLFFGKR